MGRLTDKKVGEVVDEMHELGYPEVDEDLVRRLCEWHQANPLPHQAALAANILTALQVRNVDIT